MSINDFSWKSHQPIHIDRRTLWILAFLTAYYWPDIVEKIFSVLDQTHVSQIAPQEIIARVDTFERENSKRMHWELEAKLIEMSTSSTGEKEYLFKNTLIQKILKTLVRIHIYNPHTQHLSFASGFMIGPNSLATARHVLEGKKIAGIYTSDGQKLTPNFQFLDTRSDTWFLRLSWANRASFIDVEKPENNLIEPKIGTFIVCVWYGSQKIEAFTSTIVTPQVTWIPGVDGEFKKWKIPILFNATGGSSWGIVISFDEKFVGIISSAWATFLTTFIVPAWVVFKAYEEFIAKIHR